MTLVESVLARQSSDDFRSDHLARLVAEGRGDVGEDGSVQVVLCECGKACRPNTRTGLCDRCCKTKWMREARVAAKNAKAPETRPCGTCGTMIPKWVNGNIHRLCGPCRLRHRQTINLKSKGAA